MTHASVIIKAYIVWTNWNLTKWCHLNSITLAWLQVTVIPNVKITFHFTVIWVTTWKGLFSAWLLSAAITWNALHSKWLFACLLIWHIGNCFEASLKNVNEHLIEIVSIKWKWMMKFFLKSYFVRLYTFVHFNGINSIIFS